MSTVESDYVKILNPLPIELAPSVFWLGECVEIPYRGELLHSGNAVYVIAGEKHSALVEAANSFHVPVVMKQIEALIEERSLPPIKYICVTHSELPHAGGVGHALTQFPDAVVCGEVSDLHLIFPQFADRLHWSEPGETFDLGGTELRVIESVIRDMPYTRWFFDTRSRVLFAGDGFAFSHDHDAKHCGHLAEDVPNLDIPTQMKMFAVAAFNYMEYIDIEPYLQRLDELIFEELDVSLIAPTHGLPMGDPAATLPKIREGFRRASNSISEGLYS
jgi:flavorubredoxin